MLNNSTSSSFLDPSIEKQNHSVLHISTLLNQPTVYTVTPLNIFSNLKQNLIKLASPVFFLSLCSDVSLQHSSAAFMSSPMHSVESERDSFNNFFQSWIDEQDRHLHELISVSKTQSETKSSRDEQERVLRPLIDRVVQHYEEYYRTKTISGKVDVLSILSPSWTSTLEDAFLWIGGWRPSMAFHLLYSKAGLQMESKLGEIIRGLRTGDLGDLSPSQLVSEDELQRRTIREETNITEKMAKHQETVADTSMVELSHIMTELQNGELDDEQVGSTLGPKEEGLQKILERADDLRLRTLIGVINILNPSQAVHYLIAAAELHLRIHDWGKNKDAAQHHTNGTGHTNSGVHHTTPGQLT